jgi:hypothetical protein
MKTKIISNISPAKIAIALFRAVAILTPASTAPTTTPIHNGTESLQKNVTTVPSYLSLPKP